MRGLVCVRRLQLGHQDPEDVEEEAEVCQDAEQPRRHVDPLHPLVRGGGQGPAQGVVGHVRAEEAVQQAGEQGEAYGEKGEWSSLFEGGGWTSTGYIFHRIKFDDGESLKRVIISIIEPQCETFKPSYR